MVIIKEHSEKTFVIAGINGDIGLEFARRFQDLGKIYGISRKNGKLDSVSYEHVCADLLNPDKVKTAFECMKLSEDVTYVHLPGKFRFQDENHPITDVNNDGIDDEIFATNVETFRNVRSYLIEHLMRNRNAKLKLIAIGSTSDLYDIPYWHSFTHAKNELRKEFRSMYGNSETYGRVSSLFINVSTVDGRGLAGERPYISKQFVLTPKDILDESLPFVLDDNVNSLEVSILKPNPAFQENGFLSIGKIRERWYGEMYGLGRN